MQPAAITQIEKWNLEPGNLNTTLNASALNKDQASILFNCDTGQGIWQLDKRYRRWQQPPVRTFTTTYAQQFTTGWVNAPNSTNVSRTGGYNWTGTANVTLADQVYAQNTLGPSNKTNYLAVAGFTPTNPIPGSATGIILEVAVLASAQPEDSSSVQILDDVVEAYSSGSPFGTNEATNTALPAIDATRTYDIPIDASYITAINNGLIGVALGYKTDAPTNYDKSAFSIALAYSGTITKHDAVNGTTVTNWDSNGDNISASASVVHDTQPGYVKVDSNGTVTVTVTHTGGSPAPEFAWVQVNPSVDVSASVYILAPSPIGGTPPNLYTYSHITDDGFSDPEIANPDPLVIDFTRSGIHVVKIPLTAGVGSVTLSLRGEMELDYQNPNGWATSTVTANLTFNAIMAPAIPCTVRVDQIQCRVKYSVASSQLVTLTGAQGIGFGSFNGVDQFMAIWGQGAFDVDGTYLPLAMGNNWGSELSGIQLDQSPWQFWQFGPQLFATNPISGTFYKDITDAESGTPSTSWHPLYLDYQTGAPLGSGYKLQSPPYDPQQVFINGTDSATVTATCTGGNTIGGTPSAPTVTVAIDGTSGLLTVSASNAYSGYYAWGYMEFEVTLGTSRNWSAAMALIWEMLPDVGQTTPNDGFWNAPSCNQVILTNSAGTSSGALAAKVDGNLNAPNGTLFGWADISGVSSAILSDVKKIKLRFGYYQTGAASYQLALMQTGGLRFHNTDANTFATANETNTAVLEYAWNYTEGGTTSSAYLLDVPAIQHLGGQRTYGSLPYAGSRLQITIPAAGAPFDGSATIHLYRKTSHGYQQIATGSNATSLVYVDVLPDSVIQADTVTYPPTSLNFNPTSPSFSGIVTNVIAGCAWKGSNIYSAKDGKIYMSRTNDFKSTLWNNVTLTNQYGSTDLGPARTVTLADDTISYARLLIPAENLYCVTDRECYVFIAGQTAATSSFPRKIDGARGTVGVRAGSHYGSSAVYGAMDGLWIVKKASDYGFQPDELIEVTKENRGIWQTLLGSSPSTLVVRTHLGEIWCFNGNNYLHFNRQGRQIYGSWADGRSVTDAVSVPYLGLVLQMSDGSLGLIGPYLTDGASDLPGTNGVVPSWRYRTGKVFHPAYPLRAIVHWVGGNNANLRIIADTENGTGSIVLTDAGENVCNKPFPRIDSNSQTMRGAYVSLDLNGIGGDQILDIVIESQPRAVPRGQGT